MHVGTILHHKYFNGVAQGEIAKKYRQQALKMFSHFGMFGTGILKAIAPKQPINTASYEWNNVDRLVEFAISNRVGIHYNTVITGHLDAFPQWYKELSSDDKYNFLQDHVKTVVNRYKGKVEYFKLVNEVTTQNEAKYLGTDLNKTDLIAHIFKWAVEESPTDKYMINEYGTLIRDEIRKPFIGLVQAIKAKGARVDLVGLQGHMGYHPVFFQLPPAKYVADSLEEIYNACKCPIHITEFDLSYNNSPLKPYAGSEINPNNSFITKEGTVYKSWFDYQNDAYKEMLDLCQSKNFVEGFLFWMFADDTTLTWERPGCGLLDGNMELKHQFLHLFYKYQ